MARKETTDEYGRALEIHLDASDALQRATLRNDVIIETARLGSRRREARRLAAKYEDKAVDARARAAVVAHEGRLATAKESENRTFVERVEPPADRSVVHGLVRGGKPGHLEIHAVGERDKVIAKAHADARGYWRLDVPVDASDKPVVTGAAMVAASQARIRIVVRAGDKELYRDKDAFAIRPGRVQYRELVVEER